jgi:preprotein translocase subunit SecF
MNHDAVFWGVIIGVACSALVAAWLLYMVYRNATKDKDGQ